MRKTTTKKNAVVLQPYDFPFNPRTDEYFTGVKSMELVQYGYDFCKRLETYIDEGTLTLKDVAELFFDYYNESTWQEFCETYSNPEKNADAFSDWLSEYDTGDEAAFIIETDEEVVFCPVAKGDYEKACDLEYIVNGICSLFSTRTVNEPGTKTVCVGKIAVNDIHTVSAEKANVAPLSAPMFTKL